LAGRLGDWQRHPPSTGAEWSAAMIVNAVGEATLVDEPEQPPALDPAPASEAAPGAAAAGAEATTTDTTTAAAAGVRGGPSPLEPWAVLYWAFLWKATKQNKTAAFPPGTHLFITALAGDYYNHYRAATARGGSQFSASQRTAEASWLCPLVYSPTAST
jgi:hypothetical protein